MATSTNESVVIRRNRRSTRFILKRGIDIFILKRRNSPKYDRLKSVLFCGKYPRHGRNAVQVKIRQSNSAELITQVCGRYWLCPTCRNKRFYIEQKKIKTIAQKNVENGYQIVMMTLTIPHTKEQTLSFLCEKLFGHHANAVSERKAGNKYGENALRNFTSGGSFDRFKKAVGFFGVISSKEFTYGIHNGWHPHVHMLIMCKNIEKLKSMETTLAKRWADCVQNAGIPVPDRTALLQYGIQFEYEMTPQIAQYLCKDADIEGEEMYDHSIKTQQAVDPIRLLETNISGKEKLFEDYASATYKLEKWSYIGECRDLKSELEEDWATSMREYAMNQSHSEIPIREESFATIRNDRKSQAMLCDYAETHTRKEIVQMVNSDHIGNGLQLSAILERVGKNWKDRK